MRRLKHINIPTRLTAFLLGLIYSLALIGQAVHQHDVEIFSLGYNDLTPGCNSSSRAESDNEEGATGSGVYLVKNFECHVCEFHLGVTDQCAVAPSFAVDEWEETPQTSLPTAVYQAPREGKALRAPPVR